MNNFPKFVIWKLNGGSKTYRWSIANPRTFPTRICIFTNYCSCYCDICPMISRNLCIQTNVLSDTILFSFWFCFLFIVKNNFFYFFFCKRGYMLAALLYKSKQVKVWLTVNHFLFILLDFVDELPTLFKWIIYPLITDCICVCYSKVTYDTHTTSLCSGLNLVSDASRLTFERLLTYLESNRALAGSYTVHLVVSLYCIAFFHCTV